jgi:hypothetical protein
MSYSDILMLAKEIDEKTGPNDVGRLYLATRERLRDNGFRITSKRERWLGEACHEAIFNRAK